MFSIFGQLPYICNVKQKQINIETFLKETKITKTQTKSRDMKVILQGGFTYTAEFFIKEEAYAKLIAAAQTFGEDNAAAMLGLYIENEVNKLQDIKNRNCVLSMLCKSTISFRTFFPSNHVTISVYGQDGLFYIDDYYKEKSQRHQEVAAQIAREFRLRYGILEFISGGLNCGDILNKEEE